MIAFTADGPREVVHSLRSLISLEFRVLLHRVHLLSFRRLHHTIRCLWPQILAVEVVHIHLILELGGSRSIFNLTLGHLVDGLYVHLSLVESIHFKASRLGCLLELVRFLLLHSVLAHSYLLLLAQPATGRPRGRLLWCGRFLWHLVSRGIVVPKLTVVEVAHQHLLFLLLRLIPTFKINVVELATRR